MTSLIGPNGNTIVATEWPGSRARVLAVHATGFCKEVWRPVATRLADAGIGVVAFDQRGHGASEAPADADWWGLGRDAAAVAAELGPFDVALGHSSGATAITMAGLMQPQLFGAMVLIEPVVFPPGAGYDTSLADGARRRRSEFVDREDAHSHFRGRGIFASWHDDALAGYLEGGLVATSDGLSLACSPELEAAFYDHGVAHGVWERLDGLQIPAWVLVGGDSTYHRGRFADELAARYGAELVVIDGADHFVPMQRPEAVVDVIERVISRS